VEDVLLSIVVRKFVTVNWFLYARCSGCAFGRASDLAIYRSRVWVLAWRHCVMALAKLLTPVCLCHKAV